MANPFDPVVGAEWTRVSPALIKVRRLTISLPLTSLAIGLFVAGGLIESARWPLVAAAALVFSGAAWTWSWAERNTAAWGYAEAERELLITSGVWWRRLVAVPYGRMQFVDVQAGPVHRLFGIATVTLHTASTETAGHILGVEAAEAARLRNALTELGESRGAGV